MELHNNMASQDILRFSWCCCRRYMRDTVMLGKQFLKFQSNAVCLSWTAWS